MKKTISIVLSIAMVLSLMTGLFTLNLSATNTEIYASTVEVTLADGTTVYLGKQPVIGTEGADAGKIIGYSETNILNILTLKNGSMTFDETTGTLTLQDIGGVKKIYSETGSLVVIVKGHNEIVNDGPNGLTVHFREYVDPNADVKVIKSNGNLTIKGDGFLSVTSTAFTVMSNCGNLEVTGDVTLEAHATADTTNTADAIHTSNGGSEGNYIRFSERATVIASSKSPYVIRSNQTGSGIYITDNANVSVSGGKTSSIAAKDIFEMTGGLLTITGPCQYGLKSDNKLIMAGGTATVDTDVTANWGSSVKTKHYIQTGGTLNIITENEETVQSFMGLDITDGSAAFKGGALNITSTNKYKDRGYGIFFKNTSSASFEGTVVDVNVSNKSRADGNGIMAMQGSSTRLDISGGKISYTGNEFTNGLFDVNVSNATVNISGGTITGNAKSFAFSQGVNMTFNITGGNIDTTSTVKNYIASDGTKTFTQSGSVLMDVNGTEFKNGTVGQVDVIEGNDPCSVAANPFETPVPVTEKTTESIPVLKLTDGTFAVAEEGIPYLVGDADIYSVVGNKLTYKDQSDYRASLATLTSAPTHGDSVSVLVNGSHGTDTSYAAAQFVVEFDNSKLAFDQASSVLGTASVTVTDGVLELVDYGADKDLQNGIYTLSFETLTAGETEVVLRSAAFSGKDSVAEKDLVEADIVRAAVSFDVQKKTFAVTLPAGFEGPETVTDGESYTFKLVDNNYNYSNFSATAGETPLDVIDNANGTYTVNNVTGDLTVTVDSVPKSYEVTFTPSDAIVSGENTATYGTDYVFNLKDNILPGETDGTNYSVESITVGGVAFSDYTVEDRKVTIPGASITGNIAVTVKVERVDANKFSVTVDGTGAGDVVTDGVTFVADKGQPYSITLKPQLGYNYTVTATVAGNNADVSVEGNVYTVQNVTGAVVFTVTRTVNTNGVTYSQFITLDSVESDVYLVLNKTTVGEGKVPTLNGVAMFWSEKYEAYCGLVIIPAPASENDVKTLISIADGSAVTVDYGMDVNKTGKVDAADAQLVYNMYNAEYSAFTGTVTQEKFLRADVNGDKVIDVTDATAIVTEILK